MATLRTAVMLLLALMLSLYALPATAQSPVMGPFCVQMTVAGVGGQAFRIFALPMSESQYLLSAVSAGFPWAGAASVTGGGTGSLFTLQAGFSLSGSAPAIVGGDVSLQTGIGTGTCSSVNSPMMVCGTGTPVTFAGVACP